MRERIDSSGIVTENEYWTTQSGTSVRNVVNEEASNQSCTDVVVPHYAKRIRQGEIINNPCLIRHEENSSAGVYTNSVHYLDSNCDSTQPSTTSFSSGASPIHRWIATGVVPGEYPKRTWTEEQMYAAAKLKAIAALDPTPYSFGEDLVELKKSLVYFKDIARDVKRITVKAHKREKFLLKSRPSDPRVHEAISDLWLQYRFAISPSVRSMFDLMEAYNIAKPERKPPRLTARGFETTKWSGSNNYQTQYFGYDYKRVGDQEISAGILYTIVEPLSGFRFKYGLRNKDIPATAWQVVPYSFMIDRVWNITNSIKAITNLFDPNVQILSAWTRSKANDDLTVRVTEAYPSMTGSCETQTRTVDNMFKNQKVFEYERNPWIPSISDVNPPTNWGNLMSDATKIMDVFTLAESYLRKRK